MLARKNSRMPALGKLTLPLPHSHTVIEQIFSRMNDVKTKKWNRLGAGNLNIILIVKPASAVTDQNCVNMSIEEQHIELH